MIIDFQYFNFILKATHRDPRVNFSSIYLKYLKVFTEIIRKKNLKRI